MRLILIRHADAVSPTVGQADAERSLSPTGREQSQQLAHFLHRHQLCPSLILCSPYRRAQQTAEPFQTICGSEIWTDSALTPTSTIEEAYSLLTNFLSLAPLGCITHQPLIGQLTTTLLRCPSLDISISPATAIIFDVHQHRGQLAATLIAVYPPLISS